METSVWSSSSHPVFRQLGPLISLTVCSKGRILIPQTSSNSTRIYNSKNLPKNLRFPRRSKLPPEPVVGLDFDPFDNNSDEQSNFAGTDCLSDKNDDNEEEEEEGVWEPDEVEAISSLFKGRIPQKPGKLGRERPLPLPLPYKIRPLGLPTQKRNVPRTTTRQFLSRRVYKNPIFLVGLAKEIKSLHEEDDVSLILNECARFLRKGSLSMTIRELGHMGLPERALQVFCWSQKQPHLFPDDRILASTVEVLAGAHELKMPLNLDRFISLASKSVYEAMVRGFIKGGSLNLAWKLVASAKENKRILDASVYAKLILELGKNPDKGMLVLDLLEELAEREDFSLTQQDCTAVMKVCVRLGKFEVVEELYNWFRKSGGNPSMVMFTTLIHSLYSEQKYREAMAVVWEMEAANCLLDLPAYRVLIKLFIALNDLQRTIRYFAKLKEAGFPPTFGIYKDVVRMYANSGRLAKCKEVSIEAEMAGFKFDERVMSQLLLQLDK